MGAIPSGSCGPGRPGPIKANWPGSAWIVEVITGTLTRKGNRSVRRHLFLTSVRTTPQTLLRLIRQCWSMENEWHWARDAQLGEDAHRYASRIGAPVFAFLRTIVMETQRGPEAIPAAARRLPLDQAGAAGAGLRHQGNVGARRCDKRRERTFIALLGSPAARPEPSQLTCATKTGATSICDYIHLEDCGY